MFGSTGIFKEESKIYYLLTVLIFYTIASVFSVKYEIRNIFVLASIVVYIYILTSFFIQKNKLKFDRIDFVLISYLILVIIYFLLQENTAVALKGAFAHLRLILFYYIGKLFCIKLNEKNIKKIVNLLITLGLLTAVYGIYQYYFDYYTLGNLLGDAEVLFRNYGGSSHRPRQMYSFFLNPLTTAYVLSTSIIVIVIDIVFNLKAKAIINKENIIKAIIAVILIFALFLTYNRTTFISIVMTAGIIIFLLLLKNSSKVVSFIKKNKLVTLGLGLGLLSAIIALFKYTKLSYFLTIFNFKDKWATAGHYEYLEKGIRFLIEYPLGLGLGVSTKAGILYENINTWNESYYFFISTEIGALGLILYLLIIIFMLNFAVRLYRLSEIKAIKKLSIISIVVLVCFSISNITLPVFMAWVPTNLIFILFGLLNYNLHLGNKLYGDKKLTIIDKIIKKISNIVLFYISSLSFRSKNTYVFGAWFGNKFLDNSKYLFLKASKSEGIRSAWITKDEEVYNYLKERNIPVYMHDSLKGILIQLRAKYFFTCTGPYDVNYPLLGGATHIELWHGIPIKKIGYDDNINYSSNRSKFKVLKEKISKAFMYIPTHKRYVVSTSPVITKIYESSFRIKSSNILELGQPRNDVFFNQNLEFENFPEDFKNKKTILYMPTHRNEGKTEIETTKIFDMEKLNKFCADNDILFLIKKHYYHRNEKIDSSFSNIRDITSENYDSQLLLKYSDILITDYSSCYIDYLLLDRPIVFYCYDINNYVVNDREMYFDYEDITPGPKVSVFENLYDTLTELIVEQSDNFLPERIKVKNMLYSKNNQQEVGEQLLSCIKEKL